MLTDQERFFADELVKMIEHVDVPMLMYQGEKDIVKKALIKILQEDQDERYDR